VPGGTPLRGGGEEKKKKGGEKAELPLIVCRLKKKEDLEYAT